MCGMANLPIPLFFLCLFVFVCVSLCNGLIYANYAKQFLKNSCRQKTKPKTILTTKWKSVFEFWISPKGCFALSFFNINLLFWERLSGQDAIMTKFCPDNLKIKRLAHFFYVSIVRCEQIRLLVKY